MSLVPKATSISLWILVNVQIKSVALVVKFVVVLSTLNRCLPLCVCVCVSMCVCVHACGGEVYVCVCV